MRGFTLIEMLIAVTIVILMTGGALAAFLSYRDRRAVNDEANLVANRLRLVQSKATAIEVPSGCGANVPSSYTASFTNGGTNLTVVANCPAPVNVPEMTLTLVVSTFDNTGSITFDSRTITSSGGTISLCGSGKLFDLTVSKSANIGKPVFNAGGC